MPPSDPELDARPPALSPSNGSALSEPNVPALSPSNGPASSSSRWFADEVQPHERSLRSYLRAKFRELPDVDDLVQETYLRLLRAREKAPVRRPKSLLFATARNAAVDFFRRRRVVTIDSLADIERLSVLEDRPNAAESLCHDQELQLLADAIQTLPPRCREVVVLRKLHGHSHRDIAQRLGISEHTVNAQLAIGVLRLRDFMQAHGLKDRTS